MKTEQILQLVEAVSGFGLDEFEYEEDGVKLKLKKGGNVCTSVSAETAGRTKTEAEIARTEENAEVLLEGTEKSAAVSAMESHNFLLHPSTNMPLLHVLFPVLLSLYSFYSFFLQLFRFYNQFYRPNRHIYIPIIFF